MKLALKNEPLGSLAYLIVKPGSSFMQANEGILGYGRNIKTNWNIKGN